MESVGEGKVHKKHTIGWKHTLFGRQEGGGSKGLNKKN